MLEVSFCLFFNQNQPKLNFNLIKFQLLKINKKKKNTSGVLVCKFFSPRSIENFVDGNLGVVTIGEDNRALLVVIVDGSISG